MNGYEKGGKLYTPRPVIILPAEAGCRSARTQYVTDNGDVLREEGYVEAEWHHGRV